MICPKCGSCVTGKHFDGCVYGYICHTCCHAWDETPENPPKKRAYISITSGKTDVLLTVSLSSSDPCCIFDEIKTECGRHLKQGDVINSIQFLEVRE